eukprot:TRINITY_DN17979_c0_g1_i1.p1 TRINITY_DN17979_c0_g1~~TRINITY_DN17979_c0_g1_i1.p1  ORF type:complete len:417 (+),score=71.62 TRINITY_DN17979_c0_g1_i1:53-1303(+)
MLAVGELPRVLEQLKASKEIYEMSIELRQGLDPVALQLYDPAKSPRKIQPGSSLDRDWNTKSVTKTQTNQNNSDKPSSQDDPKAEASNKSSSGTTALIFKKVPVVIEPPRTSLLADVIGPIAKIKKMTLTVFYNEVSHKLSVADTVNVQDVVDEMKKVVPAVKELSSITLCMAEDDGTPDDDFGALGLEHPIRNIGRTFVLQGRERAPSGGTIKISLPGNQFHTVRVTPDMTVRALLRKVCDKRQFDTVDHYFHYVHSPQALSMSLSIEQLESRELVLAKGGPPDTTSSAKANSEDTSGPKVFYSEAEAFAYKKFTVTKLKKFGTKQERILGIDKNTVTNSSPKLKARQTKRPKRSISDVKKVYLHPSKPKTFSLEYINDNKTYTYEAKTRDEAREIVGKIQFCVKRHKRSASRSS